MFEIYVLDSTRFNDCMVSWFVHTVDSMHPRKMYECIWSFGDNIMYSFAHTSYLSPTNKRVISGSGVTSYIFFFKYLFFLWRLFSRRSTVSVSSLLHRYLKGRQMKRIHFGEYIHRIETPRTYIIMLDTFIWTRFFKM